MPATLDRRAADMAFVGLGLTFAMTPNGELQLGGALGTEFPPGAVMADADHYAPLASAPEGAANVSGLIRTLFPTAQADAQVLVPDTAESRILRYLPADLEWGEADGVKCELVGSGQWAVGCGETGDRRSSGQTEQDASTGAGG